MSEKQRVRLFLDSNLLTAGIVSTWGLDKAILSLCAARICRLDSRRCGREEVEENLLIRLGAVESKEANRVLDNYARLIALMKPAAVPYSVQAEVKRGAAFDSACGRRSSALVCNRKPPRLVPHSQHETLHSGGRATDRLTGCNAR